MSLKRLWALMIVIVSVIIDHPVNPFTIGLSNGKVHKLDEHGAESVRKEIQVLPKDVRTTNNETLLGVHGTIDGNKKNIPIVNKILDQRQKYINDKNDSLIKTAKSVIEVDTLKEKWKTVKNATNNTKTTNEDFIKFNHTQQSQEGGIKAFMQKNSTSSNCNGTNCATADTQFVVNKTKYIGHVSSSSIRHNILDSIITATENQTFLPLNYEGTKRRYKEQSGKIYNLKIKDNPNDVKTEENTTTMSIQRKSEQEIYDSVITNTTSESEIKINTVRNSNASDILQDSEYKYSTKDHSALDGKIDTTIGRNVENVYGGDNSYDYSNVTVSSLAPQTTSSFPNWLWVISNSSEQHRTEASSISTKFDNQDLTSPDSEYEKASSVLPKSYFIDKSTISTDTENISHKVKKSYGSTLPFLIELRSSYTTESTWKVNTMIERNYVADTKQNFKDAELIPTQNLDFAFKTDLRLPRVTSENNLNNTFIDVSSLEDLTKILRNVPLENSSLIENITGVTTTSKAPKTIKLHTVISNRGGYMNITQPQNSEAPIDVTNINGTDFSDKGRQTFSDSRSQIQIADDEILEQLLKEKKFNENQANADRLQITTTNSRKQDEALNVQPLTTEKLKHSISYLVSPNYKPLKKIDIQPPKPFLRDPDDNSWRNESISSLGIVFNPNNSSKSLKQVLKNKTENEVVNVSEKDEKIYLSELRQKLGKIAKERKSKKKTTDKFDLFYNDYDESKETKLKVLAVVDSSEKLKKAERTTRPPLLTLLRIWQNDTSEDEESQKSSRNKKKLLGRVEYNDSNDDDIDFDYMANIDLKKFIGPEITNTSMMYTTKNDTQALKQNLSERKATVQYFPPKQKQVVNFDFYDSSFNDKVNSYITNERAQPLKPQITLPQRTELSQGHQNKQFDTNPISLDYIIDKNKSYYNIAPVSSTKPKSASETVYQDENYDRASYFSKNYRGFFNEAKDVNDEVPIDYMQPPTITPIRTDYVDAFFKEPKAVEISPNYDYDMQFRKDVLNRFIDNFKKNRELSNVNFPVVYNNSVVHRKAPDSGRVVASSRAFLKSLYDMPATKYNVHSMLQQSPNSTNNTTLDFTPDYEMEYYIPDDEQLDETDIRSHYRFR